MLLALLLACGGADPDDSDTTMDSGDNDTDEVVDTATPPDPSPFTVTVRGEESLELTFDLPICSVRASNLRTFWRNAAGDHVFVLVTDVLGGYAGAGTYTADQGARVSLQEEQGGTGLFWMADAAAGDTVTVTVEYADETRAWGGVEVSGLGGGAVTLSPQPLPLWCAQFDQAR
jgi:hypothetical protein